MQEKPISAGPPLQGHWLQNTSYRDLLPRGYKRQLAQDMGQGSDHLDGGQPPSPRGLSAKLHSIKYNPAGGLEELQQQIKTNDDKP